ncbi:multiheme c-type cytochrome [Chitinophaga agri]|uniref:Cytochrome c-552/4 domain-containing protein n=1 Tax=Chitinophaga agri TaxID=2703787 RepID=A0A6B9ZGU6_9BACT|nr:multiheme c-type cytochrome [Chitinophaga agri]QHS61286.1 hypothetical protein GWR21_17275 [Chitinophaga agri]
MSRRQFYVTVLITSCIFIFSQCFRKAPEKVNTDVRGEQFAGAATCISCHKQIYDAYVATGHYNTSAPASEKSIKGPFTGDNIFSYSNGTRVVMEARDSGLFQAAYTDSTLQEVHRFDITMGSGRKAQSFLYWQADRYFQLPLSYFVPAHSWANSPGFPPSYPKFDRMIPSTCFGCHSSAVGIKEVHMEGRRLSESFEKNQLVYGIDCERCHGPAADHVAFHREHPQEKTAMHMTRVKMLKNQQRLDMCALCHSGLGTPQKPAFDYKPGDALSDYFFPDFTRPTRAADLDVHGKQYQLFTASRCFVKSDEMNCSSCHNPHNNERDQLATFSRRCMACHQPAGPAFCKLKSLSASVLEKNCIDCHMPVLPSGSITLLTDGQTRATPDSMRTHLITVYPEEVKKILARFK